MCNARRVPCLLVAALLLLGRGNLAAQEQGECGAAATASVSGTVLDPSGAAVAGARVALHAAVGPPVRTLTSGASGDFIFTRVPVDAYAVTVDAPGFAPFTTTRFTVTCVRIYTLSPIVLSIAGVAASVIVRPTEVIAADQIKAEEKQRVFGIVPNFYVSYIPDAAPMTARQKFSLAVRHTFDWTSFAGATAAAGIEQAADVHPGYGDGGSGYAKRWAAGFARERSQDLLSHYAFASLFHQDPRYFYQGTGTKRSRLYHALSNAFVARADSGKTMPNYAYLLGDVGAAAISNAYYPRDDRGVGLILTNAAIGVAGRAVQGVVQEFVGKRVTKNVPESR
jgi:hypothetical protein